MVLTWIRGLITVYLGVKTCSFRPGVHLRTGAGDCWGLGVMRTWTRSCGATERLRSIQVAILEKLGAGEVFSRVELCGTPPSHREPVGRWISLMGSCRYGVQCSTLKLGNGWLQVPPAVLTWIRRVTMCAHTTEKKRLSIVRSMCVLQGIFMLR